MLGLNTAPPHPVLWGTGSQTQGFVNAGQLQPQQQKEYFPSLHTYSGTTRTARYAGSQSLEHMLIHVQQAYIIQCLLAQLENI